jgi:hypothetical protein
MANASTRDAREGYEIFLSARGDTSRDSINLVLETNGYRPISDRTFHHYENLLNAGYTRYIPINRFDVARSSYFYQRIAASSRYIFRDAEAPVLVLFQKRGRIFQVPGVAREVGDVGAVLTFGADRSIDLLEKVKPSHLDLVVIQIAESQRNIEARVVEANFLARPVQVEVEYRRLVSLDEIAPGEASLLPQGEQRYVLVPSNLDEIAVDVIGQRFIAFFEFIEAARSLVNAVGRQNSTASYAPPPTLDRLEFASPIVIDINIAQAVFLAIPVTVVGLLLKAADARKRWHKGTILKERAEQEKITTRQLQAQELATSKETREEGADVERTYEQAKVNFGKSVRAALAEALPDYYIPSPEFERIVTEELMPAVEAMADAGVATIGTRRPPTARTGSGQGELSL